MYRLGKLPVKYDSRTIRFSNIVNKKALPTIPDAFDVDSQYPGLIDNRMFLNDSLGDCVIAGRGHCTLRFEEFEQKQLINITDKEISTEYFKESGGEDSGLIMLDSLNAWRLGWIAASKTYTIYAFSILDRSNHGEIKAGIFLLNGVYIGFIVPQSAMDQFNQHKMWSVVADDGGIVGGHCIYIVGYNSIGPIAITWGSRQQMTWEFWDRYVDEAYGVVDNIDSWVNPTTDPVNVIVLKQYLDDITSAPTPVSGTVTFNGQVSATDGNLGNVTITIKDQNGTVVDSLMLMTDPNGAYSIIYKKAYGTYTAQAYVFEDSQYKAATSDIISFTIGPNQSKVYLGRV